MHSFAAACYAEYLKARRSAMLWLTIAALCLAPLFGALFVVVLRNPALTAGNELLKAKAAVAGFEADWPSFLNLIAQAIGVGGVIVFGFAASWIYGREHADHTIKDLLCLQVSRTTIVLAKLTTCVGWCLVITVAVTIVGLVTGALLRLEGWAPGMLHAALGRTLLTAAMAIALCPPVAFVASAGRGYLAPLGFVIMTVVIAQIIGALGFGAYVPWAVPALFSGLGSEAGGSLSLVSYALLTATSAAGIIGTVLWWNLADQTT